MDTTLPQNAASTHAGPDPVVDPGFRERYDVGGEVGRGGMGAVYRGRHRRLDMPVAIKVM
jgi:eukaryotic-like serine/threonine-protein kinase